MLFRLVSRTNETHSNSDVTLRVGRGRERGGGDDEEQSRWIWEQIKTDQRKREEFRKGVLVLKRRKRELR